MKDVSEAGKKKKRGTKKNLRSDTSGDETVGEKSTTYEILGKRQGTHNVNSGPVAVRQQTNREGKPRHGEKARQSHAAGPLWSVTSDMTPSRHAM